MVPIRTRTICHIRREIPRDKRRAPYTITWHSVEIVAERPYCAAHAVAVTPILEESAKMVHEGDHVEIPGSGYER
jgi:hypothetical protein